MYQDAGQFVKLEFPTKNFLILEKKALIWEYVLVYDAFLSLEQKVSLYKMLV